MQFKNAVAGLIAVSFVTLSGCATSDMQNIVGSGNAMATGNKNLSVTNADKVKLFYTNDGLSHHYTIVGRVSAENYNMVGMQHTQETISEELKKQAASIGANGVINIKSGLTQTIGDAVLQK